MSDKTDENEKLIFKGKFTAEEEEMIVSGNFGDATKEQKRVYSMARAFAGMCGLTDN